MTCICNPRDELARVNAICPQHGHLHRPKKDRRHCPCPTCFDCSCPPEKECVNRDAGTCRCEKELRRIGSDERLLPGDRVRLVFPGSTYEFPVEEWMVGGFTPRDREALYRKCGVTAKIEWWGRR